MKRLPPRPLLISLVLTTLLVWAVPRAILSSGARVMAGMFGISPELRPVVLLLLAAGVAGVVLLDFTITRERTFAANLVPADAHECVAALSEVGVAVLAALMAAAMAGAALRKRRAS